MDQRYQKAGHNHVPRSGAPLNKLKRLGKIAAFGLLGLATLGLALLLAGVIVVQTAWFKNRVRDRIQSVMELATGGRVEIGSFSYNWHNLTAEVAPFVLHGTEPASAPPLFRADKIQIGLENYFGAGEKGGCRVAPGRQPAPIHHDWSGWVHQPPQAEGCTPQPERYRRSAGTSREAYRTPAWHGGLQFLARSTGCDRRSTANVAVIPSLRAALSLRHFLRAHARLLAKVTHPRRVRSGFPGGTGQKYYPSAAREPGIRRNEDRGPGKHRRSLLASRKLRGNRRTPGGRAQQDFPDPALAVRRPVAAGPRRRRWDVHRPVYRHGSQGARWGTFTRASTITTSQSEISQ